MGKNPVLFGDGDDVVMVDGVAASIVDGGDIADAFSIRCSHSI